MYYSSLYNWIREHDIKKPKSNSEKKDTKTSSQKKHEVNGMTQNGLFDIFSNVCMRKRHLFCTSSHHNVPYENQQELNKGSEP